MNGMVVAAQPEAAEAGANILRKGGNAVDAAIAAAFVQGVVDPQMTSIGGFGAMQIFSPSRDGATTLEFYARAPLVATPDMWAPNFIRQTADGFKFILNDHANETGYLAVATPGNLKGYCEALESYGTMDLADVIKPAVDIAREGFMVRPYMHYYWTIDGHPEGAGTLSEKLKFSPEGRLMYFRPDGSLKKPGDIITNNSLAVTLERIARAGPDIFYTGEIAEEIADDMSRNGGLITKADLRAYQASWLKPTTGSYRNHIISSLPAPGGGILLIELLNIMENFDLKAIGHNTAEYVRIFSEAMRQMAIDKDRWFGDPDYVDVPEEMLLSKKYAADCAARIRRGERVQVERPGKSREPDMKDTTHVTVADQHGNCVSLTHTLGSPPGTITNGLGFMYNGAMGAFDPRPGFANSIAAGKRRGSALSPTIVLKDDKPVMAMGAPGGTYIVPAIAQSIINIIDHDMSVLESIVAPRFVALNKHIEVSNRIERGVTRQLEALGYSIKRTHQTYPFAAVHAISFANGKLFGAADPQRDGAAIAG